MRKNVASQYVAFQMNSTTDGSAVTSGTPTVYYTIDGGTQGTGAGTATHEGNGQWSYAPAQAETNGNHVAFTMALSGAISQTVNVYPVSTDLQTTSTPTVNVTQVSGDSTAADNLEQDYDGTGYNKSNSTIGTTTTNTDMRGTDSAYTGTPPTVVQIRQEMDSNSTQFAAIVGDTNELQTDWANGGRLDVLLDQAAAGGGGSTSPVLLQSTTLATVSSQTSMTLTAGSADDDAYNGCMAVFIDQSTSTQIGRALITDYTGATKTLTLDAAPEFTVAVNDTVKIVAVPKQLPNAAPGQSAGVARKADADAIAVASSPQLLQTTTIDVLSSQTSFTLTAGSSDDDAYNEQIVIITDQSTITQKAVGVVSDYVGSTKTVTLAADPGVFTMAAGDSIDIVATSGVASRLGTAAQAQLAGITITPSVPTWDGTQWSEPFRRGDYYIDNGSEDSRASITISNWTGPDISAADSVTLRARRKDGTEFSWDATATQSDATTYVLYWSLSGGDGGDTDQLPGTWKFAVSASWSGPTEVRTLATGVLEMADGWVDV